MMMMTQVAHFAGFGHTPEIPPGILESRESLRVTWTRGAAGAGRSRRKASPRAARPPFHVSTAPINGSAASANGSSSVTTGSVAAINDSIALPPKVTFAARKERERSAGRQHSTRPSLCRRECQR
eukprot:883834-Rhodomonas_salina.2